MSSSKSLPLLLGGTVVGAVAFAFLAAHAGPAAIAAVLVGGGWPLLIASAYRIVTLVLNTVSWEALLPAAARPPRLTLLRLRWIGESVNALLPVAQIGGDFARARLLAQGGVSGGEATAAMVVDVSIGAATQVIFTLMGVVALARGAPDGLPGGSRVGSIALAIAMTAGIAISLVAVARLGVSRLVAALPIHGHRRLAARLTAGAAGVDRALAGMIGRRAALVRASLWHLAGWLSQVGETWIVLRLLGAPVSWVAALAIESLAASARGAAFAIPGGLGVQEGALVLLCGAFGVGPPTALALGLIKRGRELLLGAPAILVWLVAERHALERMWRTKNTKERRRTSRETGLNAGAVSRLRVGVLVDLPWSPNAGGHVKTWERLANAAVSVSADEPLDLTIHFLGDRPATHVIGPHVRYRIHKPLLSTTSFPFLSQMPGHTDLAPHNPLLTGRLRGFDVIHTTDGNFASARTAARVARWHGIPLTNSVHTTTPYYTQVFTRAMIERFAGNGALSRLLLDKWDVPGRAEARAQRLLDAHHRRCAFVLASRPADRQRLEALLGRERVGLLRRGIDHLLFDPRRRDRAWLEATFGIPRDRLVVISVGRLDRIKNVLVLARAIRSLVDRGAPVHLLCPGRGPDRDALIATLADRVTCPGVLDPETLARAAASADVSAQPSLIEELSNAVLEASSSGLPLLVGAAGGSARFVIHGETGLVVRGETEAEWSAALGALLDDPARLAAMGRAARSWSVANVPTWPDVLLQDLLPVWRRVSDGVTIGEPSNREPEDGGELVGTSERGPAPSAIRSSGPS